MFKQVILSAHRSLVLILFASCAVFSGAQTAPPQSSQNAGKAAPAPANAAAGAAQAQAVAPAQPSTAAGRPAPVWQGSQLNRLSGRAEMYYEGVWGIGELRVKAAESGEIIRFNYRVLDPQKAATLNDKKVEPELIDSQGGVKLSVPQMEKVGKLRQSSTPKPGMTYWMAFANPTLAVRRGHRVDIVIGSFHANGLLVE